MRFAIGHAIRVTSICVMLLVLHNCIFPCAASPDSRKKNSVDLAIGEIRFYAWYQGLADEVCYQELEAFPVGDDQNEYPPFDIVLTVTNYGQFLSDPARLKVVFTYKVGPHPTEEESDAPEQAYERAKKQAEWHEPEWAKWLEVGSLEPGESYKVRVCVPIKEDWERYWDKGLWPYRARVKAFVKSVRGEENKNNNRIQKDLEIDMLC